MQVKRTDKNEVVLEVGATGYEWGAVYQALHASARRSKDAGYVQRAEIVETMASLIESAVKGRSAETVRRDLTLGTTP